MTLLQLFYSFLQIGLFSVGGGYAAIPLIRNQTVDIHRWLTPEQFMDLAAIAEMTPGPIAVNGATFVGLRIAGIPGAAIATLGCITPSLIIVSLLAYIYRKYKEMPLLRSTLASLRPAVVALIFSAGVSMLIQIVFGARDQIAFSGIRWAPMILFIVAFVVLRKCKWNPILVIGLCGAFGLLLGTAGVM